MTDSRLAVIVLAAGKGTRMRSDLPKVLHPIAGRPMLGHVIEAVESLEPAATVVVVGPGMEAVAEAAAPHASAVQEQQLGTGDAVRAARGALSAFLEDATPGAREILVAFGDTPLVTPETLAAMVTARRTPQQDHPAPDLVLLGFEPEEPEGYGRIVRDAEGHPVAIVEEKDADEAQRAIPLCNAGLMLADAVRLFDWLERVGSDNAKGEFYLTDLAHLAREDGRMTALVEGSEEEVMGVNSRAEQAAAEAVLQRRLRARALAAGVTLIDPASTWLSSDTTFGRDVVIEPSVFIGPGVALGDGVRVRAFCHLEQVRLEARAAVGPFARLRGGAVIGEDCRLGNFVEVKNATLARGAKAAHLSYLGDALVGEGANVGAGTITCNYDGFGKHRTEIGPGAFIGSNTALVAPVTVGAGALVAAGSTITDDVPPDALAVARGRQATLDKGAARFRASRQGAKKTAGKKSGKKES